MWCADARIMMDEAMDGHQSPALAEHLATCDDCRAEWERLRQVDALLWSLPAPEVPEGFLERTMARLEQGAAAPWLGNPALRSLLSVFTLGVGLLLILVGAAAVLQSVHQPTEAAAWLAWGSTATDVAARLALLAVPSLGRDMAAWPLFGGLALVIALIWFGVLVVPRRVARHSSRR